MYLYTVKVASVQYRAVTANKALNICSLSDLVKEAAENGARIIVLPEMCTTGFTIENATEAGCFAETIPGPTTNAFAELAKHYKATIALGLAEYDQATNKFYNTQILLDSTGQIICTYRKINLFGPDHNWAEIGNLGYQSVDTKWGRIGLGICFDINYPDFLDFISKANVTIFAFSTNWVGDELPFPYWSEMVSKGGYYFIAANNWGSEGAIDFSGGSTILSPDLTVLSQSTTPANVILYANISVNPVPLI